MKTYSTREAAKLLGIHLATLQRYIAEGKISVPAVQHIGGNRFRAWTDRDIERARKQLPRIANGRKKRGKKNETNEKSRTAAHGPDRDN